MPAPLRLGLASLLLPLLAACGGDLAGCDPTPPDAGPPVALTLGEDPTGDGFRAFVDGGDATLILGRQGSWMVLLAVQPGLDAPASDCHLLEVRTTLEGGVFGDPLLRAGAATAPGVPLEALQLVLAPALENLDGLRLGLEVELRAPTYVAVGSVDVTLRRETP